MIKKTLDKYGRYFLVLILPYIFMLFVLIYRVDFTASLPGGLSNTEDAIRFEESFAITSEYHSIYIMPLSRPTLFQVFLMQLDDASDMRVIPRGTPTVSTRVNFQSGQLQADNAWNQAVIALYNHLDLEIEYDVHWQVVLYFDDVIQRSETNHQLAIRDTIVSVNDRTDIIEALTETPCEEEAKLTVLKEGATETVDIYITKQPTPNSCQFLIQLDQYYEIISKEVDFELVFSIIGGPSGGLIHFLYMYDVLTEEPLADGLKISGTGTLDKDGNARAVGGIRQKVITAHLQGVDVFFVPHLSQSSSDNYIQARNVKEELGIDLTIVPVTHWQDAVDYLLSLREEE